MDQDHQERIRQRAHEIWESEGRPEGRDTDHWSRAQEELKNEMGEDQPAQDEAEPEVAQAAEPAKPKRARKSAKTKTSAKSDTVPTTESTEQVGSAPYLSDGP